MNKSYIHITFKNNNNLFIRILRYCYHEEMRERRREGEN